MFAAIYVPDFAVQALLRLQPEHMRSQAVAVLDGNPPLVQVVAANEQARIWGVEPGMTRVQAEACAGLVLLRRSEAQEQAAHEALLDCAYSVSPRLEATAQDVIVADVSGLEQLFGAPPVIARELAQRVAACGMEARVAIAGNIESAIHAARGFSGTAVITAGEEAARLGALPVEILSPKVEVLETLERWGVRTFAALGKLPSLPLTQRLGQEGLRLQKLARGEDRRPLLPHENAARFAETLELEDAIELLEPLAFVVSRMLEQICARLQTRALAAMELRLVLELELSEDVQISQRGPELPTKDAKESTHVRTLKFPVPMQDARTFLRLLQLDLRAHPPQAPVKKLTITAEPAQPRSTQTGLFAARSPEPEKLELTLARIRGVVGDREHQRVGVAELLDTHRPDAFQVVPFSPSAKISQLRAAAEPVSALRRFRPVLQANVEVRGGVPHRMTVLGATLPAPGYLRGEVVHASGPWRCSGEWWDEHAWAREEWDVAFRSQRELLLYRVYRDLNNGAWWVEGEFD